jgi:hypothetical protein
VTKIIISSIMDELKQYAETQEKLHYLIETVKMFSNNINPYPANVENRVSS